MYKKINFILFLLITFLFFFSCKGKNISKNDKTSDSSEKSGPVIGFSIDTLAIERWQRDLDTFISTASNLGAEVIVQNAGNSAVEQKRQLLYLASENVDCVVVLPRDSQNIKEGLDRLISQNIPVIAYDRLILDTNIDLYLTIDSEKVGYLMGNKMRSVTPYSSWALILGSKDDYNMEMIERGLWNAIKGTDISVCDIFYTSGWNYDLSRQHTFEMITQGIVPNAIICGNDAVADSVISVLDTHLGKTHIPICGQDADIVACQNIISGKQDFTIYKPITELARLAAELSVKLASGESVSSLVSDGRTIDNHLKKVPVIMLDPVCVTKNNIDEIIIESGFHTYNEVYR